MTTNAPTHVEDGIAIRRGKIPNGTYDVARYLGLDPSKTIFYHATSFDPEDESHRARWAINSGNFLYAEAIVLTPEFEEGAPLSAIAHYNPDYLAYYDEIGFTNTKNLVQVGVPFKTGYPYNAVSRNLCQRIRVDSSLRKRLQGYTFVASYLSQWDVEMAEMTGGALLMDSSHQEKFNSKFFYREAMEKDNIPALVPGVCVTGIAELSDKLSSLANAIGGSAADTKIWTKLENQTAGCGTMPFAGNLQDDEMLARIQAWLDETGHLLFSDEYIRNEMRFVIELDASHIPGEEIIGEFNVQAVISSDTVTLVGSAWCAADDEGGFIGNYIASGPEYDEMRDAAENAVIRPFAALCRRGYRGYMTNDVIVTRNEKDGSLRGWCIDPNARFAAATVLVRGVHKAEVETGEHVYGSLFSGMLPCARGEWLESTKRLMGTDMVSSKDAHLLGLTPTLIADVTEFDPGWVTHTMALDADYAEATRKFETYKQRLWQARQDRSRE